MIGKLLYGFHSSDTGVCYLETLHVTVIWKATEKPPYVRTTGGTTCVSFRALFGARANLDDTEALTYEPALARRAN